MKAIILVAGYATRLYPLTKTTPKPLLEVGGKPIINYILDEINTLDDVDEVFVTSNHKFAEHFKKWAETVESKKPVKVIDDGTTNEDNRRGAIGDIQYTIEQGNIDDDVVIIAGDNLFTYKLKENEEYFKEKQADCVCVKTIEDREELKQLGVVSLDENGKVISLEEKPQEPKSDKAAFATYMYTKETVKLFKKYLDEGNKPDAPGYFLQWLHTRKPVYGWTMTGECYDVGTLKALEEVREIFG
ncbi:MAG: nucleotidyltransferase family protein [Firmicutes bacterium]|nr:nucleotidyltransferase family protein [Bacillota bacterium]